MENESQNDDGQDSKVNDADTDADAKPEAKKPEGEAEKLTDPDPKEVIADLKKSDDTRDDQRHNLDAGLEKMQHTMGQMARELAELKKFPLQSGVAVKEDPFAVLDGGEDIADVNQLKKGLQVIDDRVGKRFDKIAEQLQQTVEQLKQAQTAAPKLTDRQQIDIVKGEFDIQDDYASYIIQQAGPKINVMDQENPSMTASARDVLVRSLLQKELDMVNKAVAQRQENKDSKPDKTTDPKAGTVSTKVTQEGASTVTHASTTSDPPLNQADSKESMIQKLVELRAAGG